ncbi:MotA/TolQ/ExbB proton channel family protein [Salinisphaera japonica]|uniref:Uncharacterized protein n=1 Tax=Salinisphaera japonica YTM-1 TaxID=1209778 RepID=A0A423Q011_9GAMM|nr:MotA/TolQ/ExbB proton channel family protein [Salinisphaera japonica]ROO31330.1 hypothetical protein SAJA_03245 [Salinisphaera japonica YTM-1]
MLSSFVEAAVSGVDAAYLTDGFIVLILAIFVLACVWKRGNRQHAFTHYAPTLMTTLGILGTFTGIVAGLLHFNVDNIDGSISTLLAGMKTAFLTSLAGMFFGIVYKVLATVGWISPREKDAIDEDAIGVAELYQVMTEQRDGVVSLREAIGSGDESSLTGQMKLLRGDMGDHFKQSRQEFAAFQENLWVKLQDFADMLSKSATEQVIEALNQVIADFNQNLTEQFGENFKQLNESVEKLVEWQERYKEQLGQMVEQYALGVSAIGQTETAVMAISTDTQKIPESLAALRDVLEVNQHQITELNRHLKAFASVRDRAVEAVPQIHDQIDATLKGVNEASEHISTGMKDAGDKLQGAIVQGAQEFVDNSGRVNQSLQSSSDVIAKNSEDVKTQFNDLLSDMNNNFRDLMAEVAKQNQALGQQFKDAGETMTTELGNAQREMMKGLEHMAERQTQEAQQVFRSLRGSIEGALSDTGDAVTKQVRMLDSQMERELSQVMTEMGRALGTISQQFTGDYQKLVREMRNVVNT